MNDNELKGRVEMISMQIISRILLKIFQFICSIFVVYCLYKTGSQWMLALTCLLIPPFGIFLILRLPKQKIRCDKYYRAVEKSWLRVEIAICFTMVVVFLGFGILLFCGFFKLMDNLYFLLAGLSSILAALLYTISSLIAVGLLRQNTMDIVVNEKAPKQMSCIAKDDPNHFSISVINEQQKTVHCRTVEDEMLERTEELKEQPIISIESTSAVLINREDVLFSAVQQSEMDQYVINYIREDLDQNLDNEINSHDNSSMAYNIDHCKNSSNSGNGIATVSSREQNRYAPARSRYNDIIPNSMKSDTIVHVTRPVKIRYRQQQYFLNKTSKECGITNRRRYSKEEDNSSKHDGCEKSSDEDSTSGLFVGPICYCNNSVLVELENLGINLQPELLIVEIPMQNIRNYNLSASDDPNLQQICITTSRIHDRRKIGRGSQRRCYSKQDFRCGSRGIQHPSHTTHTESDDEGSPSPTNYSNTIRRRQKISNLSREQESVDSSCMPPIVTAIDSGRESDIIQKNSPRRSSSRNKKMRNRGFNMEIKAQSDDERFADRRRTLSASSSSHDKSIDAYLVTEF